MGRIDLNDLEVFAAVVDHGGFTAAGKVLGLLEKMPGVPARRGRFQFRSYRRR